MPETAIKYNDKVELNTPRSSVPHLLQFRGTLRDSSYNEIKLPRLVDVLVLAELGMLFLRNGFVDYHPVAWLVGLFLAGYIAMLVFRPKPRSSTKLLFLGFMAVVLSVAIPYRTGETILSAGYVALGGLLTIFYVLGTRVALTVMLGYLAYTAYALWVFPFPVGGTVGYTLSGLVAVTSVMLLVGLVMNHMSLQAELNRELAERKARELEQTLASLRMATSAGKVGTFSHSHNSPYWTVNSSFRSLLELPEQAYPQVQLEDVLQRIAPDELSFAMERFNGKHSEEPGSYQLQMPNGKRILVTTMAQRVTEAGGGWTRYGIVYKNEA